MLAACGGTASQQQPSRQLIALTVNPAIADNSVSDTVQFHATGTYDQQPFTQANVNAQWTVSPLPDGGTVAADIDPVTGNATCITDGSTIVTATAPGKAGEVRGSATLNCHSVGDSAAVIQLQGCQDWTNDDTTFRCSFLTPTTAGNSIIIFALTSGSDVPTVTDNAGHFYTQDLNYLFGTQRVVFYSAGHVSNTETVTFTSQSSVHWQAVIMEVRGLMSTSSPEDQASTNDNGYSSGGSGGPYPFTSGTVTTTQNNEMMVGWAEQAYSNAPNFTFTDDPPWILVQQLPIGGSRIAYRTVNVIGTYAYTGTFSGLGAYDTGAAVITYKLAL